MQTGDRNGVMAALDHVGIVVPNLEEAIAWYSSVLGLRLLWRQDRHDVPGKAVGLRGNSMVRLAGAMLEAGPGRGIELHEYLIPPVESRDRKLHQAGINHLALAVSDIDEAVARLEKSGVRFEASPQLIATGILAGRRWVYGHDPFGVILELCQHPDRTGKAAG